MEKLRVVRQHVTNSLEKKRADKEIGSSLEAAPIVYIQDKALYDLTKKFLLLIYASQVI